jgi:hypothetical protein
LTVTLDEPLSLAANQRLGVAVRLDAEGAGRSICLGMCVAGAGAGTSFWSNAAAEPYTWQDLVTAFDLGNLLVEAVAP